MAEMTSRHLPQKSSVFTGGREGFIIKAIQQYSLVSIYNMWSNYLCCPVRHLSLHVRPDQQERDMCSFNLVHQFDGHFFGLDSQLKGKKKVESSQNHLQSKVKNTYISFGHIHKSSLQQETTYTVLLSPFFTSYNCPYSVVERKSCTC